MAGMFGFLDTSKPGPGVSKNAPQKKPFFLFWELYARKFWKLVIANLLYVLVSLPVLSGGLAQAGLTFVTRNYVREKHVFLPSDFWDTIKKNWKQALIIGIEELLIGVLLGFDLVYAWNGMMMGETASIGALLFFAVSLFVTVSFLQIRYYLYLQLITFK
ncbi:MAG: YesL family protein, partial [Clostridia bacterium]|nr:YesL family protein [Clostridia bacterium]